ncbi:hypothetical protein FRC18_000444 [Serendipita sp. 400]|nr:hypothetical protein FRC18_000444 [Serendipita sp. 400]
MDFPYVQDISEALFSREVGHIHKFFINDSSQRVPKLSQAAFKSIKRAPSPGRGQEAHNPQVRSEEFHKLLPRSYHFKSHRSYESPQHRGSISPPEETVSTGKETASLPENVIPVRSDERKSRFAPSTEHVGLSCDPSTIDFPPNANHFISTRWINFTPNSHGISQINASDPCPPSTQHVLGAPLVLKLKWKGSSPQRAQKQPYQNKQFLPCSRDTAQLSMITEVDSALTTQGAPRSCTQESAVILAPFEPSTSISSVLTTEAEVVKPSSSELVSTDLPNYGSPLEFMPTPVSPSREISRSPTPEKATPKCEKTPVSSSSFQVPLTPVSPIFSTSLSTVILLSSPQPRHSSLLSDAINLPPREASSSLSNDNASDQDVVDMDISPEPTPSGGLMLTLGPSPSEIGQVDNCVTVVADITTFSGSKHPSDQDIQCLQPEPSSLGVSSEVTPSSPQVDALRRRFLEAMEAAEKRGREVHKIKNLLITETSLFDGDLSDEEDTMPEMTSRLFEKAKRRSPSFCSPQPWKGSKHQTSDGTEFRQVPTPNSHSPSPSIAPRPLLFDTRNSIHAVAPMCVPASTRRHAYHQSRPSKSSTGVMIPGSNPIYSGSIPVLEKSVDNTYTLTKEDEDVLNGNTFAALSLLEGLKKA